MSTPTKFEMIPSGDATALLPTGGNQKPITVIGTEAIRGTFDELCLQQAINSRTAPGVTELVLNPDAPLRLRGAGGLRAGFTDARLPGAGGCRYQVFDESAADQPAGRGCR